MFDKLKARLAKRKKLSEERRQAAKKKSEEREAQMNKIFDNVVDLGDKFNRARYMESDGKQ